jgi:imidazolonepropionase-like amidohydrolase
VAGQVAPGYRADLVLLASDPLAGHRALRDTPAPDARPAGGFPAARVLSRLRDA